MSRNRRSRPCVASHPLRGRFLGGVLMPPAADGVPVPAREASFADEAGLAGSFCPRLSATFGQNSIGFQAKGGYYNHNVSMHHRGGGRQCGSSGRVCVNNPQFSNWIRVIDWAFDTSGKTCGDRHLCDVAPHPGTMRCNLIQHPPHSQYMPFCSMYPRTGSGTRNRMDFPS